MGTNNNLEPFSFSELQGQGGGSPDRAGALGNRSMWRAQVGDPATGREGTKVGREQEGYTNFPLPNLQSPDRNSTRKSGGCLWSVGVGLLGQGVVREGCLSGALSNRFLTFTSRSIITTTSPYCFCFCCCCLLWFCLFLFFSAFWECISEYFLPLKSRVPPVLCPKFWH